MQIRWTPRFTNSIIFRSLLLLVLSMSIIISVGTYFFTSTQQEKALSWAYSTNKTQLQQLASTTKNVMEEFEQRIDLLSKTSEIQTSNAIVSAAYLKSYSISALFIPGETISLFDRHDSLICDNSMLGMQRITYPIDYDAFSPHRATASQWYRDSDGTPKKAYGISVMNPAHGDGSLVASFSFRRLWKYLKDFKVGEKGYAIAINGNGEIFYHPDLKKWMSGIHKISELGFRNFNTKLYEVKEPTFVKLSDHKSYLVNYIYLSTQDLGLITLQPKIEIDELIRSTKLISGLVYLGAIIAVLLSSLWLLLILGRPLNHLVEHITKITEGNLDVSLINVGDRKDEIGQLSKVFNLMHCTIKSQIQQLNKHQEQLEEEVSKRTAELEEANRKLDRISRTDELTGLPNRRDMNESIEKEVVRAWRMHKPFCLVFFDIDHFKSINDTYGHAAGDAVLKNVSMTVQKLLRKYDILARYGGEEFLTLLPETDLEGSTAVAERFRQQVEELTVYYAQHKIKVTVTLGVAQFDHRLGIDRSIQLADKALYEGKESGRNKVVVWDPARTTENDYRQAVLDSTLLSQSHDLL